MRPLNLGLLGIVYQVGRICFILIPESLVVCGKMISKWYPNHLSPSISLEDMLIAAGLMV
jgi:hypothetical protein